VGCSDAPREQLGVQCLAHGHFDLQLMGRAGIEPTTLGLQDDPRTPLSYSRPRNTCLCSYLFPHSVCRYALIVSVWSLRRRGSNTHVDADFLFVHVDQKDLHDVIGGPLKDALPQGLVSVTELPPFWTTRSISDRNRCPTTNYLIYHVKKRQKRSRTSTLVNTVQIELLGIVLYL